MRKGKIDWGWIKSWLKWDILTTEPSAHSHIFWLFKQERSRM